VSGSATSTRLVPAGLFSIRQNRIAPTNAPVWPIRGYWWGMSFDLAALNWLAILVGVVAGQVVSTVWFVVLFGEPWAREYGAPNKQQHTKEVPGYTYGVGALCTAALTISLALLQAALGITTVGGALGLAALVSVGFCIATIVPGQAFLKRWRVAALTFGSQTAMIFAISIVLAAFGR